MLKTEAKTERPAWMDEMARATVPLEMGAVVRVSQTAQTATVGQLAVVVAVHPDSDFVRIAFYDRIWGDSAPMPTDTLTLALDHAGGFGPALRAYVQHPMGYVALGDAVRRHMLGDTTDADRLKLGRAWAEVSDG